MPFEKFQKKEIYKFNDYDEVKNWSIEKRNENCEEINPDIICKLALDGIEGFVHSYCLKEEIAEKKRPHCYFDRNSLTEEEKQKIIEQALETDKGCGCWLPAGIQKHYSS